MEEERENLVIEEDKKIIKLLRDAYGIKNEKRARSLIDDYKKLKFLRKVSAIIGAVLALDVIIPDPIPYVDEMIIAGAFIAVSQAHTNIVKKLYSASDNNIMRAAQAAMNIKNKQNTSSISDKANIVKKRGL